MNKKNILCTFADVSGRRAVEESGDGSEQAVGLFQGFQTSEGHGQHSMLRRRTAPFVVHIIC